MNLQVLIVLTTFLSVHGFLSSNKYNFRTRLRRPVAVTPAAVISCTKPVLKNGLARIRNRGKFLRFQCSTTYVLVGDKYASCTNGRWDNPTPLCIKPGCPDLKAPQNGLLYYEHKKAAVKLFCNLHYTQAGSLTTYCDGLEWDRPLGVCRETNVGLMPSCDFETSDLCGWQNDPSHDFDWIRSDGIVSTKSLKTGPKHDHTTMKSLAGHFLIVDSSEQLTNETTRLISPPYPADANSSRGCFEFWYHMYGDAVGKLRVYVKPVSLMWDDIRNSAEYLFYEISGNQKNEWNRGFFSFDEMTESFQVIIEATMGLTYKSDIAIDDVNLMPESECPEFTTEEIEDAAVFDSTVPTFTEDDDIFRIESCENRCNDDQWLPMSRSSNLLECECNIGCLWKKTCCPDYKERCIFNAYVYTDEDDFQWTTTIPTRKTTTSSTTITSSSSTTTTTPKPSTTTMKPTTTTLKPTTTTLKPTTSTPKPTTTTPKPTTTTPKPTTTTPKSTTITTPSTTSTSSRPITRTTGTIKKSTTTRPFTRMFTIPSTKLTTHLSKIDTTTQTTMKISTQTTPPPPSYLITLPEKEIYDYDPVEPFPMYVQKGTDTPENDSVLLLAAPIIILIVIALAIMITILRRSFSGASMLRRIKQKSMKRTSGPSVGANEDIRFLTADEQIDFTLATPDEM